MTVTRIEYVKACLAALGAPACQNNIDVMQAKIIQEWSGASGKGPTDNALDLTESEPGVTPFNTFGGGLHVWNYETLAEGAKAFHDILQAFQYGEVVAFLKACSPAESTMDAWNRTAWGFCNPAFIGQYRANRSFYDALVVADHSPAPAPAPAPRPPAPLPEVSDMAVITTDPNNNGKVILDPNTGTWQGLGNPGVYEYLRDVVKVPEVSAPTKDVFSHFRQTGTI